MTDPRVEVLREAEGYVTKDRNSSYGEPEDNFKAIADIWNAQGYRKFDKYGEPCLMISTDVALMMVGMKLARLKHNPSHRDSWVDTIGYGACGWQTVAKAQPESEQPVTDSHVTDAVSGWLSNFRCGERVLATQYDKFGAKDHPAHMYEGAGNKWCDGFVTPDVKPESDIDVIKRVADRTQRMTDAAQSPVVTRPIKDNPQA